MDGPLKLPDRLLVRAQGAVLGAVLSLPRAARRALAGPPVVRDGQRLELDTQVLLRLNALSRAPELRDLDVAQGRRRVARDAASAAGRPRGGVAARPVCIGPQIQARLYIPDAAEGAALLVFFHGGGFVVCDLDTHDATCRLLAAAAGVRVLSVDYRRAPEHRFPAAAEDAWTALCYAAENGQVLGIDPARIAVGGDSAGGNLAAGVAQRAARDGGPPVAAQLLIYPWLDLTRERRSHRLFGEGFYLTVADLEWYRTHYLSDPAQARDARCSPLLADDVHGIAPAYIATAGFDPLRDEGEEYAARLHAAGVNVVLQRHAGLIHGFANTLGVGTAGREAVLQAAGALRFALAQRSGAPPAP